MRTPQDSEGVITVRGDAKLQPDNPFFVHFPFEAYSSWLVASAHWRYRYHGNTIPSRVPRGIFVPNQEHVGVSVCLTPQKITVLSRIGYPSRSTWRRKDEKGKWNMLSQTCNVVASSEDNVQLRPKEWTFWHTNIWRGRLMYCTPFVLYAGFLISIFMLKAESTTAPKTYEKW